MNPHATGWIAEVVDQGSALPWQRVPTVSLTPTSAPPDHATQPARDERDVGSRVNREGVGWPTSLAWGACANAAGNLQIWHS